MYLCKYAESTPKRESAAIYESATSSNEGSVRIHSSSNEGSEEISKWLHWYTCIIP